VARKGCIVENRAMSDRAHSYLIKTHVRDPRAAQTELNFKFYRQATNKIGGISDAAARFLQEFL
jgi:hypothetical protein